MVLSAPANHWSEFHISSVNLNKKGVELWDMQSVNALQKAFNSLLLFLVFFSVKLGQMCFPLLDLQVYEWVSDRVSQ